MGWRKGVGQARPQANGVIGRQREAASCRSAPLRSATVATCRGWSWVPLAARRASLRVRHLSRHAAARRDRSHLFDVGNVLRNRCWRNHVLLAKRRFHASAIEMTFRAIALNTPRCAGEPGAGVLLQGLVDREREIAVGGGRDKSRHVVVHWIDDTAARPTSRRLSPSAMTKVAGPLDKSNRVTI